MPRPLQVAQVLLENLSRRTWCRVKDGQELKIRQGEVAITEDLLLEIARSRHPNVVDVTKTSLKDESLQGTDWEWWVRRPNEKSFFRYAVQAKVIGEDNRYRSLGHKVRDRYQLCVLDEFARKNSAIPLYVLYNYVSGTPLDGVWHCGRRRSKVQLGCTVVPSHVVRKALCKDNQDVKPNFSSIHQNRGAVPWRCLLCRSLDPQVLVSPGFELKRYENVPPSPSSVVDQVGNQFHFDPDYYQGDESCFPKRIAVFDLKEESGGSKCHGDR